MLLQRDFAFVKGAITLYPGSSSNATGTQRSFERLRNPSRMTKATRAPTPHGSGGSRLKRRPRVQEGDLSSCGDSPPYSRRKSAAEEPPETYYRGRQAVVTMTTNDDYPINQMMKDGSIMGTSEVMLIVETGGTTVWSGTIG